MGKYDLIQKEINAMLKIYGSMDTLSYLSINVALIALAERTHIDDLKGAVNNVIDDIYGESMGKVSKGNAYRRLQ
jgi:hypothetical protein